jgi:hypothetical protein
LSRGSGFQGRHNEWGKINILNKKLGSAFKIIELLSQKKGYSVGTFGLLAAHNFCKPVQLSLLAADSKQLNNNAS